MTPRFVTALRQSSSTGFLVRLFLLSLLLNAVLVNGVLFLFPGEFRSIGVKGLLGSTLLLSCSSAVILFRRSFSSPGAQQAGELRASTSTNEETKMMPGSAGQNNSTYWLSEEQAQEIRQKVDQYLKQEHAFLQQKFRVADLAEGVGVSRHQLAACFTQAYDSNFNEVINRRRVQYGLQEVDPEKWEQYTVEGMAHHLGFGSRATFNTHFKKVTGMTPAVYRQVRAQYVGGPYPHDHADAPRSISVSRK